MNTVLDDQFYSVEEGDGIFLMTWKDGTKEMNDEVFVAHASAFLDVLKEKQHKKIIVDMRQLYFEPSAEATKWRNENLVAYYNEIGVEKFAFVATPEQPVVDQDDSENTFVTKTFESLEDAFEWIR